MVGNNDRLNRAALWTMVTLIIVSTWYPFMLDLPRRVVNSASKHPGGAWDLDSNSRLISRAPAAVAELMSASRFQMIVEALSAVAEQAGPARLVSIGGNPYDPGLMIGIDHHDVVLYLPCDGAARDVDADWRVPFGGQQALVVSLWIEAGDAGTTVVSMQVNDQPRARLQNRCPPGSWPRLPEASAPWALGNVASGHRPFVGRLLKWEMTQDGRSVDLLRALPWQAPSEFWILPERLYQPSGGASDELPATMWHFASFALLGYLLAGTGHHRRIAQRLAAIVVLAAILNGGKVLIATRHPGAVDFVLNVAGAATTLYLRRRFTTDPDRAVAPRSERERTTPGS